MAAFNGNRAKSIYNHSRGSTCSCWCTGISTGKKFNIFDRHGTLSRQYGAQQLAGSAGVPGAIGQVVGFVSGVVGFLVVFG